MKNVSAVCAIAVVCACSGSGTTASSSAGRGSGEGAFTEHPVVCDAPMCDADEGLYGLSVSLPPVEMEGVDPAALRVDLARRIAERTPELVLVAHWLTGTPTGEPRLDAALKAHPLPPEGRRRLVTVLDRDFGGWRDLGRIPWPVVVEGKSEAPYESAWQGLETSGCGEMRLQMALGGVTVHERDDNFSGDRVYCIVRATDGAGDMELSRTDVSPALEPGDAHLYTDGTFFGRGGARDPGDSLKVEYDCWEMDDASEYERFEEIIDQIMQVAKVLGVDGALVKYELVARVLIELGKLFDGDDYLFRTVENFTRQDLWVLAASQPERSFTARGTHSGSDWSWEFSVSASACAVGANTGPGTVEGYDDGGTESPPTCDGCWVGSTCQAGNSNDACGRGGSDCASCEGLESCQGGACAFDSTRTVDVAAVAARVPGTDPNGSDWDLLGDPAPEVVMRVSVGGRTGSTSMQEGYSLRWDTIVIRDVPVSELMQSLEVSLGDDDAATEEPIDGCYGAVDRVDIEAGEVTWGCGTSEVTLGFR